MLNTVPLLGNKPAGIRQRLQRAGLAGLAAGASFIALIYSPAIANRDINLAVGSVSAQDLLAPYSFSFESRVLTEMERQAAVQAVLPVYSSVDPQIARIQGDALRDALTYITTVRADPFASQEEKLADLALLAGGGLDPAIASGLLNLPLGAWQSVQQESLELLQRLMQSPVRPEQLGEARGSLPSLVGLTLSNTEADLAVGLVGLYIAPNSFYDQESTEANRTAARASIEVVIRSYLAGETIVPRGRVLTEADIEALQVVGLIELNGSPLEPLSAILVVVLTSSLLTVYFARYPEILGNSKQALLLTFVYLLFIFAARLSVIGRIVLPFMFPVAAFGLVIASLFGGSAGLILPIPLSVLIAFGAPNALELTLYYILSTLFGVLMLGRSQRIISFFWAGIGAAGIGAAVIVAGRLLDQQTDLIGLMTLVGAALVYGVLSGGGAILLQFFAAQILGKTTNLQLMQLSRPEQPLLRFLLLKAPGTYQHSLQVSNLAEQAAEQIGADPLLTRVGALYHDVGKSLNPQYFIENQIPGIPNLHEQLTPLASAEIILRHVPDGVALAKKHRLPVPLQNFIREHHGTTTTSYQYGKALELANGEKSAVDIRAFTYPGPPPQSRETALVMLADGCEARARSERPATEPALRELVKETVDKRISEHQLDQTELTARDVNLIIESLTSTLKGVYHPRLEYPRLDRQTTRPVVERIPAVSEIPAPESSGPND